MRREAWLRKMSPGVQFTELPQLTGPIHPVHAMIPSDVLSLRRLAELRHRQPEGSWLWPVFVYRALGYRGVIETDLLLAY